MPLTARLQLWRACLRWCTRGRPSELPSRIQQDHMIVMLHWQRRGPATVCCRAWTRQRRCRSMMIPQRHRSRWWVPATASAVAATTSQREAPRLLLRRPRCPPSLHLRRRRRLPLWRRLQRHADEWRPSRWRALYALVPAAAVLPATEAFIHLQLRVRMPAARPRPPTSADSQKSRLLEPLRTMQALPQQSQAPPIHGSGVSGLRSGRVRTARLTAQRRSRRCGSSATPCMPRVATLQRDSAPAARHPLAVLGAATAAALLKDAKTAAVSAITAGRTSGCGSLAKATVAHHRRLLQRCRHRRRAG